MTRVESASLQTHLIPKYNQKSSGRESSTKDFILPQVKIIMEGRTQIAMYDPKYK